MIQTQLIQVRRILVQRDLRIQLRSAVDLEVPSRGAHHLRGCESGRTLSSPHHRVLHFRDRDHGLVCRRHESGHGLLCRHESVHGLLCRHESGHDLVCHHGSGHDLVCLHDCDHDLVCHHGNGHGLVWELLWALL